jgi:gamma-glutamyltranspeptidase/glutathione hydrolase
MPPPDAAFWDFPYVSQRMPLLAANVVSTSQPLAASAGLAMLAQGGNAADAALATAIALTVVEPCQNGIGGDAFALIWADGRLHGLNASGRAPRRMTRRHFDGRDAIPSRGWDSVTTPGTVSAWRAVSDRFGKLPFADLFAPAIRYAREGYMVSPTVQRQWQSQVAELLPHPGYREAFAPQGRAPLPGDVFICPGQARTLERIAASKGDDFYRGELAKAIADHARATGGLLDEDDLAAHTCDWVEPIAMDYRDIALHEIGPNGQGIGALMALGMLRTFDLARSGLDSVDTLHLQIEAMKLAFADMYAFVGDAAHMTNVSAAHLLDRDYLTRRARAIIALQNRGFGFTLKAGHPNEVAPGKRPFHTIIPGFITRGGAPLMSFGVMGGSMQAQGHMQIACRIADFGQNPQAASDAPRWRVLDDNTTVAVEWNFPKDAIAGLEARGHTIRVAARFDTEFGCGQFAMKTEHGYIAASDHRKDGYPVGF